MGDGNARSWEIRARPPRGAAASRLNTAEWNASGLRPGRRAGLISVCCAAAVAVVWGLQPGFAELLFHAALWLVLAFAMTLRLTALAMSRTPSPPPALTDEQLPTYTIIAPLYREERVAEQLAKALGSLDYPADRLQILLVLETDDLVTWAAVNRLALPAPFEVFVAPQGWPRTKPRACNEALAHARGDLLVVYDAEDRPSAGQLREAAARFVADPGLSCLQAPLRVDDSPRFLQRQFALEYAAQFEVMLPALHRLGIPFPLGGSSNHFRTAALRRLGGWDAYNVTEDADVAFRMAAAGLRTGLLRSPTHEQAPSSLEEWLPQRGRWLKGHLQTWCVHAGRPRTGGWRRFAALQATLGLGLVSAFGHGPLLALLVARSLSNVARSSPPSAHAVDLALVALGWLVAVLVMGLGAKRAGLRLRGTDALCAPLYWPLHSLAAVRAVWQWFTRPFHWDKTEHRPVE